MIDFRQNAACNLRIRPEINQISFDVEVSQRQILFYHCAKSHKMKVIYPPKKGFLLIIKLLVCIYDFTSTWLIIVWRVYIPLITKRFRKNCGMFFIFEFVKDNCETDQRFAKYFRSLSSILVLLPYRIVSMSISRCSYFIKWQSVKVVQCLTFCHYCAVLFLF